MILQSHENWIISTIQPRFPELVQPIRDAVNAYNEICESENINESMISPILKAAYSKRRPLYEIGIGYLQKLTAKYELAQVAVSQMFISKQAHVRFNAVISLGVDTPHEYSFRHLRDALKDKSAKVRKKAADRTLLLQMKDLLPALEEQIEIETDAKIRKSQLFYLHLLRDGFILEERGNGEYTVTVQKGRGISGRYVSNAELKEKGIESIVKELKERQY